MSVIGLCKYKSIPCLAAYLPAYGEKKKAVKIFNLNLHSVFQN
jgi:hypothetical protein